MLEMCRRDQWSATDLDWSQAPREMGRDDEMAIVQYFTDMAGIELLAGALFREQERRVSNPVLREIFGTFVIDEERHSEVARRLARFYDVHGYREYIQSPALTKFFPHFIRAVSLLGNDVANAYILGGELILDIALLRSIDDYVDDAMSAQAMRLINRDESRHIAIDYHMAEYYASEEYLAAGASRTSPLGVRAAAWWTFANVLFHAKPFFRDVFFEPMRRLDGNGARMREAFRRMDLLTVKQAAAGAPFARFVKSTKELYNRPIVGRVFGGLASRALGLENEFMVRFASEADLARAQGMTYDDLAQEALGAKESEPGAGERSARSTIA
jgi:hypothetical protein